MQTMKKSGDGPQLCRSPTPTVCGRDLTHPTRTQPSEQEYSDWRPVTRGREHRTPATLTKAFHEEPGDILTQGRQNMCRRLWYIPKISRKFVGEWMLCLCCYQRWDRIRISGVDSGRILRFSFRPGSGPGVKNLWKNGPGSGVTFNFGRSRSLCGHFLSKNMGKLRLDRWL